MGYNLFDKMNRESSVEEIYAKYNATDKTFENYTLIDLFNKTVKKYPNNIAIKNGNEEISYEKLHKMAVKVADSLNAKGIRSGDKIGIIASRKISTLINIIGTLMAGAAYVPIEPEFPEERKTFGQVSNKTKQEIGQAIEEKKAYLEEKALNERLLAEDIDISLPGNRLPVGSVHPLTRVKEDLEELFLGMGYKVAEGPEVESDHFNFELMNLPKGHPARDMQDTFYIDENTLMRTHTSPVQAHVMLEAKGKGPIKVICPGKTYRRDDDDATHSHQFMQCEGLVIDKNITMGDLKGTLDVFAKKMFGEKREIRLRPSYFPFTEPSVEVDISCANCGGKGCAMCKGTGWIEVLGAGMVNPHVLEMCGFDPKEYQGFAFGIGLERVAMLKYDIDNIRDFYNNDLRFLEQFERKE